MRDRFRCWLAAVAALLLAGAGCTSGKILYLPGDLTRPTAPVMTSAAPEEPVVAVLDFTYAGTPPYEIGRDFDHARSIVWQSDPGKELANLVADVLKEQGIPAVRVSGESDVPVNATAKVWGQVDELRVYTKKTGSLRLSIEISSSITATLHASGGSAPPGWSSNLSSDYMSTEPLFITPGSVRNAVSGAANTVAEEAVKRLISAGAVHRPAGWQEPPREERTR